MHQRHDRKQSVVRTAFAAVGLFASSITNAGGLSVEYFEQAYLKSSTPTAGHFFGRAVALEGDLLAIGASGDRSADGVQGDEGATRSGAVYIFRRGVDGTWIQEAFLKADNTDAEDLFGQALGLSGDTLVVGAPFEDSSVLPTDNRRLNSGAAYVFVRTAPGSWTQQTMLKASNRGTGDRFGTAVAIDGDRLLVGSPGEDSGSSSASDNSTENAGAAYVFERTGDAWSEVAYLKADDAGFGDEFGFSVALDGDRAAIGAPLDDGLPNFPGTPHGIESGSVYVFSLLGRAGWVQEAWLKPANSDMHDNFGWSVAMVGTTLVAGAIGEDGNGLDANDDSTTDSGAAYVYSRSTGSWIEEAYLKAAEPDNFDEFGKSLALSGSRLVVGTPGDDSDGSSEADNSIIGSGAAHVFEKAPGGWAQIAFLKASDPDGRADYGEAVAIDGERIVVGAFGDDSGVAGDPLDGSASGAGAVHVYEPGFFVGGTVSGLEGGGLFLRNNNLDALSVAGNGPFTFSQRVPDGGAYAVTVGADPREPSQTCEVTNDVGTVNGADVDDVQVTCTTDEFTVGGRVTGLLGTGLVIQNNEADDLVINADGLFSFPTALLDQSDYEVTVAQRPSSPNQVCPVSNATGTLAGSDVGSVSITCTTLSYTVGGTVSGLGGSDLVLKINDGEILTVAVDGPFTFPTSLPDLSTYDVEIRSQPDDPPQICTITNGSGAIAGMNVTDVSVTCDPGKVSIGGFVVDLAGSGLVLDNNGTENLPISASGLFTFPTPVDIGTPYEVSVVTDPSQPAQTCTVNNASGIAPAVNVTDVIVRCVTATTDLVISKTDGETQVPIGSTLTYTITVANNGPLDTVGAVVRDLLPTALINASWQCTPSVGAACVTSGSGNIETSVDLDAGASVTFSLTATTVAGISSVTNQASVYAPGGLIDSDFSNNVATDVTATILVFDSGFETTDAQAGLRSAALTGISAVRAGATPAPTPALPGVVWNGNLATVAADWASQCVLDFNAARSLDFNALTGTGITVGETIFASSAGLDDAGAMQGAVDAWAAQAADYDLVTDTCNSGASCSSYTQLVWRDSTAVGCAVADCPGIFGGTGGRLVVCDFAPGGNVLGTTPY